MWDDTLVEHVIAESPIFNRWRDDYFADDVDFAAYQRFLMKDPLAGRVIPGTGGLRKTRWSQGNRGKRGGLRVVYLLLPEVSHIYLVDVYSKQEQSDLSHDDRQALTELANEYRALMSKPRREKKR